MKKEYYLNLLAQADGYREVHTSDCSFLPNKATAIPLGEFTSCEHSLDAAKKLYPQVDGCYYCCRECHLR